MLKDIIFDKNRQLVHNNREQTLSYLKKTCSDKEYAFWENATIGDVLKEIKPGIYEFYDVNKPDIYLEHQTLDSSEECDYETACNNVYISYPFGVCDNYEQILERVENISYYLESDKKFCIILTPIKKSHQPSIGGWRWHKWGEYIGDQTPTTEYLYDEPNIEQVYVFSIYRIYDK